MIKIYCCRVRRSRVSSRVIVKVGAIRWKRLSSVGPFCRKGLRDSSRPAAKTGLHAGQRDAVERTSAHGFALRSKVLLGKEDLPKFATTGRNGHKFTAPIDSRRSVRSNATDDALRFHT
jgi:hypothetical protein